MSLKDWKLNDWLVAHTTSPQEIAGLLAVVDRDLQDSAVSGLSVDWRLNIAYNAALQAATAALAACGYRAVREAHHFRVIQSLVYTIGLEGNTVMQFDAFRKKRNVGGYERAGMSPINNKATRSVFENHFAKTVNSALTSLSRPLLSTAETT